MESIKNAVEVGLGAAFVSRSAVKKEVELGRLTVLTVRGVPLTRTLLCITDPVRYCSQAVRAFIQEMFGVTIEPSSAGCFVGEVRLRVLNCWPSAALCPRRFEHLPDDATAHRKPGFCHPPFHSFVSLDGHRDMSASA